jgi:formyl-CoA transferase
MVPTDTPGATAWVGPALGAHNAEILGSIGYDEAQQRELKQRRVI